MTALASRTYKLDSAPTWGHMGIDVWGEDAEDVVVLWGAVKECSVASNMPLAASPCPGVGSFPSSS